MPNNIECEVKALVSESDYQKLYKAYRDVGEVREQENIYFKDTKGVFEVLKIGMRIRQKKNNIKLTIKVPNEVGLLEINQLISAEEMAYILNSNYFPNGEIKDYLSSINITPNELKIISKLHTTRLVVHLKEYELCIDKNLYNNKVDYEIEVEGPTVELARTYIKNVFEKEKILFEENHLSKYLRATR